MILYDSSSLTTLSDYFDYFSSYIITVVVRKRIILCIFQFLRSMMLSSHASKRTDADIRNVMNECCSDPASAEKKYGHFKDWDTSMGRFNNNISRWDTSQVIRMYNIFHGVRSFDGDVSRWNVGRVTIYEG